MKCDETKPSCKRCLTAGRICSGYQKPADGPRPVPRSPPIYSHWGHNDRELRAIDRYRSVGSTLLPSDDEQATYWSHSILRGCHRSAAIRSGVIAFGLLYEDFDTQNGSQMAPRKTDAVLAREIAAYRELSGHQEMIDAIQAASLFAAISLAVRDHQSCIEHMMHGVSMIDSIISNATEEIKSELPPVYLRFHGLGTIFSAYRCFPDGNMGSIEMHSTPLRLWSWWLRVVGPLPGESHHLTAEDESTGRTISKAITTFVLEMDVCRLQNQEEPPGYRQTQATLCESLSLWYQGLQSRMNQQVKPGLNIGMVAELRLRYLITRVALGSCAHQSTDVPANQFAEDFEEIISIAADMASNIWPKPLILMVAAFFVFAKGPTSDIQAKCPGLLYNKPGNM